MSQRPFEKILKQQVLANRLLQPEFRTARLVQRMQEPYYADSLSAALESLNHRSALLEAANSILARPAMANQLESLTKSADDIRKQFARALLPDRLSLTAMADRMAKQVKLFSTAGLVTTAWPRLLEKQMAAVQIPWLDPHVASLSFEGFAVVSRLGRAVRYTEPFDQAAREQIDDDLGNPIEVNDDAGPDERDVAHLEANMNGAMLSISPVAVGDVLIETGFVFKAEFAPLPPTTDGSNPGHKFHPGHHMLITTVEQKLRTAIDSRMQEQYGPTWTETRVDPKLLQEWVDRRDKAVASGEKPLALIQYSNFMDLKDIVVKRQHWRETFRSIFGKREHFQTSMERLHPIRLPLAHSRPIGIGQQYHLVAEASHILRALGVDIFE